MTAMRRRIRVLEGRPSLVLARLLRTIRRLEGQPEALSRWMEGLTSAELLAIEQAGPGDLGGLTAAELDRIAAGEDPEAVLGAEQVRARGLR